MREGGCIGNGDTYNTHRTRGVRSPVVTVPHGGPWQGLTLLGSPLLYSSAIGAIGGLCCLPSHPIHPVTIIVRTGGGSSGNKWGWW